MTPPKKWQPSNQQVLTYGDFEDLAKGGRVFFVSRMFNGQPRSGYYLLNMSYGVVTMLIQTGRIFLAEMSPKYEEWLRKEMMGA